MFVGGTRRILRLCVWVILTPKMRQQAFDRVGFRVVVELPDEQELPNNEQECDRDDRNEVIDRGSVRQNHLACYGKHHDFYNGINGIAEDHLDEFDANDDGHCRGQIALQGFRTGNDFRETDVEKQSEGGSGNRSQDTDANQNFKPNRDAVKLGLDHILQNKVLQS